MKRKYLLIGLISLLITLSIVTFFLIKDRSKDSNVTYIDDNGDNGFNLILEKEYKSDNLWEYKVTGKFPNPCYTAAVDEVVRESYPEQVTILVSISKPSDGMICAQVITDYEHEGTFSASEKASVKLEIKQ